MKKSLFAILNLLFILISLTAFGQTAPNILYNPSSAILTAGTAMTAMTPTNSGGAVAALSYGTGTSITGGSLDHPYGVAVDASGNVYVANYGVDRQDLGSISKYNVTTHAWSTFTTTSIANPSGIAIDNSGNVFVLNYARTNNGNGNQNGNAYVTEYNSSGTYLGTIVQGLGTANGISINSSNGNLDIAEGSYNTGNTIVAEYTTAGALNFTISNANISNPVNVATDGSGNIYVLNNTPNKVVKFSSTGTYISTLITSGLTNPYGLYVDGSGNIYVSDSTNGTNTIDVYNSSGTFLTSISGLTSPQGLATDSKGNVYVTDFTNNTLTQYGATGGYFISGKLPAGLSFDYTTGTISGTPTVAFSSTTYTITAYNAGGSSSTTVTLSCNANAALPTILYTPFSVNVYTTNATITTLVPTVTNMSSPATGPFSYSISGTLPTGLSFSTSTGQISGKPTVVQAATLYTITATNGSGSAAATVSIATVVADYWIGKTSTDWNTGSNWSTGAPPTSTGYASIGEQPYTGKKLEPTISSTQAITVGYLTFGSTHAATLTIQTPTTGGTLTVSNILTINDNAAPIITGAGKVNMASTSVVNVAGAGALTINTGLTFTLQSGATSSASVAAMTSGGIFGNVTVERYIPGGAGYRGYILLSSPVNTGTADSYGNKIYSINYLLNSTYITGTNFTTTTFSKAGNPSLYLYRENLAPVTTSFITGNYRGISDISASPSYTINLDGSGFDIPIGNGYLMFFRGGTGTVNPYTTTSTPAPATLSTTGTLNQGSITFKHWYTPGTSGLMYTTASGTPTLEGFNLVGNPYACTIDLTTYATGGISMTNLSKFVYELDPISKTYGVYTLDASAGATNNASKYIASGQGFFVMASSASPTPQLTFNESCKVENIQNSGASLLLSKAPIVNIVPRYLRLQMALDSTNKEETIISFNDNAKTSYVFNEDAIYRQGSGKVNIASLSSDNKTIAVNTIPLDTKGISVRLKVGAVANGTYSLKMNSIKGIPELYDVWLMDAYRKDSVDMRHNDSYLFDVNLADTNSYGTHRFTLIMRQNPALAYHLLNFTASKATGKQVQINWVTENEANYTNFTVERSTDGGSTYAVVGGVPSTGAGAYGLLDRNPGENNLYRLKQEDINNNITYSHIIPVGFANQSNTLAGNSINVYPNPASSTVSVAVKTAVSSNSASYHFTIVNSFGLVIKQGTSTQANWQTNIADLPAGSYIVRVLDSKAGNYIGDTKLIKY